MNEITEFIASISADALYRRLSSVKIDSIAHKCLWKRLKIRDSFDHQIMRSIASVCNNHYENQLHLNNDIS